MIKLQLEWREVLWWMQGGMAGSHLRWSVYEDMVNKVWPQCTEQERRNIHYIMERDFGTYWRNSEGDWKPESEIFNKTPFEYFRQVLARFDPDNQYAVTMKCKSSEAISHSCVWRYSQPCASGDHWKSDTFETTVRTYKWQDEYRIDWERRCSETYIVKIEKMTIPDNGTM